MRSNKQKNWSRDQLLHKDKASASLKSGHLPLNLRLLREHNVTALILSYKRSHSDRCHNHKPSKAARDYENWMGSNNRGNFNGVKIQFLLTSPMHQLLMVTAFDLQKCVTFLFNGALAPTLSLVMNLV